MTPLRRSKGGVAGVAGENGRHERECRRDRQVASFAGDRIMSIDLNIPARTVMRLVDIDEDRMIEIWLVSAASVSCCVVDLDMLCVATSTTGTQREATKASLSGDGQRQEDGEGTSVHREDCRQA